MTQREALATKIAEIRQHAEYCSEGCCDGLIADFILADRKRVLDEIEKPLKEYFCTSPYDDGDPVRIALAKIAELKET